MCAYSLKFYQLIYYIEKKIRLSQSISRVFAFGIARLPICYILPVDNIINNFDRYKDIALVMLDFSKVFDAANHKIILSKLKHCGLSNTPLCFMKSYLTNRQQIVKTSRGTSLSKHIPSNVPQGSTLGPLFYSIYTFDLHTSLKYCCNIMQMILNFDSTDLGSVSYKPHVDLINIKNNCNTNCF